MKAVKTLLREPLAIFAEQMENNLHNYDGDKGVAGWLKSDLQELAGRVDDEMAEFRDAMDNLRKWQNSLAGIRKMGLEIKGGRATTNAIQQRLAKAAISELADAANFCMMVADNLRLQCLVEEKEEAANAKV